MEEWGPRYERRRPPPRPTPGTSSACRPPSTRAPSPTPSTNFSQTINFNSLSDREYGAGLKLVATTTSGLPVTYRSLTPDICQIIYPSQGPTVQATYPLSGLEFANCAVEASQSGDSRFKPAVSVQRSFNWIKSAMRISVSRSTRMVGKGPHTVDAAVSFMDSSKMSGLRSLGHNLDVTSMTPTVCTVIRTDPSDQRGGIYSRSSINPLSNGLCQLSFTFTGNSERKIATLTWSGIISGR